VEKYLIFVYGTLKKGFSNHYFLDGAHFVDYAVTKEKYALYVSYIPYLSKDEKISKIYGEVYKVDFDMLKRVDMLEEHPDWYKREVVDVYLLNKNKLVKSWIYFFPNPEGELIKDGVYTEL
jgi:gamma-glutamylaminecyclotransferase